MRFDFTHLHTDDEGIVVDSEYAITLRLDPTKDLKDQILAEAMTLNLLATRVDGTEIDGYLVYDCDDLPVLEVFAE